MTKKKTKQQNQHGNDTLWKPDILKAFSACTTKYRINQRNTLIRNIVELVREEGDSPKGQKVCIVI